jgi:hypothetical protein
MMILVYGAQDWAEVIENWRCEEEYRYIVLPVLIVLFTF